MHKFVLLSFNKELHKEAIVVEGEEVMTLRQEEQGTHKLFGNPSKVPKDTWRPPCLGGGLGDVVSGTFSVNQTRGVNRGAREDERRHQKNRGNEAGQKLAVPGKVAWRKTSKESSYSAKVEQQRGRALNILDP